MRPLKRALPGCLVLVMNFVITSAELRRDIEYANVGGQSLQMDISIPQGNGPFPAVIVVHGGGWVRGDKRTDVAPLFEPLSQAGLAWFSIDYRLTSDWSRFGEAVGDVEAAVRFVKAHAAEYHVDPARLALLGESAGGQLAGVVALNSAPDLQVRCAVLMYAPTDLVSLAQTSAFVPEALRGAVQTSPIAAWLAGKLERLSPARNVHPGMPPILLIHGTEDPLVPYEQSREMCERARGVGAQCELFPVPGAGHGLRWWETNGALARPYKREMVRWLLEHLENPVQVGLAGRHSQQ